MSANSANPPPVLCLMGPTASGKTALAVELVQHLPAEIVSVDSAQVYRGMDIGSGKPDTETLAIAPHRLIDIRDPSQAYSAADFRVDALEQIDEILASGHIPLLVGGTMLYFKVLRDGLAKMPNADPDVRAQIDRLARERGWAAVHAQLAEVDPDAARRIHPNDPQRLQRALEVYRVSGRTMSELHDLERTQGSELPFRLHFTALVPEPREALHRRIADRFHGMLRQGLVGEVEALYARGDLTLDLPAIRSVGYRQVWQYLAGQYGFDEMVERGIIATRQLAKRQYTWLRSWPELTILDERSEKSLEILLNIVDSASI